MNKQIRLNKIYVKKLFGRFTYDIDLNNGNDVAIFIAPNGCGKTTIFKIIEFIFKPSTDNHHFLIDTPFELCTCTLSNGVKVSLEKKESEGKKKKSNNTTVDTYYHSGENGGQGKKEFLLVIDNGEKHKMDITHYVYGNTRYYDGEDFTDEEYLKSIYRREREKIAGFLLESEDVEESGRRSLGESFAVGILKFLTKFDCRIDVNFIAADRLHKPIPSPRKYKDRGRYRVYEEPAKDPLISIQNNISALYADTDEKYKKLVSEARDKLPKMYLAVEDDKDLPEYSVFEKEWKEYVDDIDRFCKIGLMEQTQQILGMRELGKAYKDKGAFLSVYLDVFKRTLEPWREQYDKLKLFIDILNKRNSVTMKELRYSPNGLILSSDGIDIPLQCMSSGEKNDLVMFYNLIFNSKNGGLVLVDEPEISLHIEWQEEYIDRLLSICEMNHLQAIIATHSPNIVNGHFELYADKGLIDERRRD